ncbi:MAG: metallophosphoesterase [Tepidisphaeraceae bacterium]
MKRTGLFILMVLVGCGAGKATESVAPSAPAREVNLLSMGDWGYRDGGANQKTVADAMAAHVKASGKKYDAMITAGDNLYVRLTGVDDPKWKTIFEEAYDPVVLDFPFYIALGNHDYEKMDDGRLKHEIEAEYARKNPQSRWKLPARWYRVDFPEDGRQGGPLVSVLVLDSYKNGIEDASWAEQLEWLKTELARPREGAWLIAVGHHPLFSNGDHGDNGVLQREWGPLFQQYALDLYVAGHDHDMQHLQIADYKPSFVLVGGGGATTRPMRIDRRGPFSRSVHGFGELNFTPDRMTVTLIGRDGLVLHELARSRDGKVQTLRTTPSDLAVPRTVKSITRDGVTTTQPTAPSR